MSGAVSVDLVRLCCFELIPGLGAQPGPFGIGWSDDVEHPESEVHGREPDPAR